MTLGELSSDQRETLEIETQRISDSPRNIVVLSPTDLQPEVIKLLVAARAPLLDILDNSTIWERIMGRASNHDTSPIGRPIIDLGNIKKSRLGDLKDYSQEQIAGNFCLALMQQIVMNFTNWGEGRPSVSGRLLDDLFDMVQNPNPDYDSVQESGPLIDKIILQKKFTGLSIIASGLDLIKDEARAPILSTLRLLSYGRQLNAIMIAESEFLTYFPRGKSKGMERNHDYDVSDIPNLLLKKAHINHSSFIGNIN